MKPDWKDAPAWAQFITMDWDGVFIWYEFKPRCIDGMWRRTIEDSRIEYVEYDVSNAIEERPHE